jgi:hypothetical protein
MRYLLPFVFFALLSCKKEPAAIPHGTATYYSQNNSAINSSGPFSFTEITVDPNPLKKGTAAKVSTNATGKNLTFSWSTPHGDIFGTGPVVYYSDSCVGTYQISCTVSDGINSATVTINVTITD